MGDIETDDQGRREPPLEGDERQTLLGFLDYQRATFAWKCGELSDEQLRVSLPPSAMTLGGMMKHLAVVEDWWFTEVVGEQPTPEPWAGVDWDADPDWEWRTAADDTGADLRATWEASVARSRSVMQDVTDLAATHPTPRRRMSVRWVLAHMVEEYARHNGHADLIRESIDGQTGE
ncbi:MAG TPA: DinB family protein [Marmoricola sp.]|nr:DinB family protein [Marmoricola sp.]